MSPSHGKVGPTPRHTKQMLERFKVAWLEGLPSRAIAERFGLRLANVYVLAMRLKLNKRGPETIWH